VDLNVIEKAGDARAAFISHERDAMPPRHKFGRERVGRHHVPARASCGENEVARNAHLLLHLTT
jgi:hypothetical protein